MTEPRGRVLLALVLTVGAVLPFDDGDVERYWSYGRAALGRSYLSGYVRDWPAWQREFTASQHQDLSLSAEVTPPQRLVPYRDFLVEYPPAFFLLTLPLVAVAPSFPVFRFLFAAAMALALLGAFVLGRRLALRLALARLSCAAMALAVAALGLPAMHRYDAAVALAIMLTLVGCLEDRPLVWGTALGLAIALKGIPAVLAPLVVLHQLERRRHRELLIGASLAAGVLIAFVLPLVWVAGPHLTEAVRYHALRPVQVESTWAGVWRILCALTGRPFSIVHSYGSVNVDGGAALALARASGPVAALALGSVYWRALPRTRRDPDRALTVGAAAALSVLMLTAKVLSPQYWVWLLPLGLIAAATRGRPAVRLFYAMLLLTQLLWPVAFPSLCAGALWPFAVVVARSVLLLGWTWSIWFAPERL